VQQQDDTAHLKDVPQPKALRERILACAVQTAAGWDKSRPLGRQELEAAARGLLAGLAQPDRYAGWTMVAMASAFWREQVGAVPAERRLLLLPRCLRNPDTCPAPCHAAGLDCQDCGACDLAGLKAEALRRGYRVMIAEGSPTVLKIILSGQVDAVLGVACLDALEQTLDKILLAGIPCMAVPLLGNGCRNTSADRDWIVRMIDTPCRPASVQPRTYLHLMRLVAGMFEPAELARLVPGRIDGRRATDDGGNDKETRRQGDKATGRRGDAETRRRGDAGTGGQPAIYNSQSTICNLQSAFRLPSSAPPPLARTEAIAREFLAAGGKHSRPLITLAVYDALTGGHGTLPHGAEHVARLPDAVKRVAMAIEVFHKASLVHDDIEDDDLTRYEQPTLHRRYGLATAINVGDYLIGLGYRLVAGGRQVLGAEATADILAQFAEAHTKLCEGQGAELFWRDDPQRDLTPLDALKIYALKTAPAFEAAILAGVRLAGPVEPHRELASRFARHLGVAYQIVNDLEDWEGDEEDSAGRRPRGAEVLHGRPTVLWALALAALAEPDRRELRALVGGSAAEADGPERARRFYDRAGAFHQARALVAKHHRRAAEAADSITIGPLRQLFHFLADAILDRRPLG
jgi:geranylgeranyl pyrophosphate synthase